MYITSRLPPPLSPFPPPSPSSSPFVSSSLSMVQVSFYFFSRRFQTLIDIEVWRFAHPAIFRIIISNALLWLDMTGFLFFPFFQIFHLLTGWYVCRGDRTIHEPSWNWRAFSAANTLSRRIYRNLCLTFLC